MRTSASDGTIPDGIILVDKPAGITSHGVVRKLRRVLRAQRIGHGGTLDPSATGLLVVFVGRATRLADYLGSGLKVYDVTIRFGIATETDDAAGEAVETAPVPQVSLGELSKHRERFLGEIKQVPPAYSAVHVNGKRAYEAARKGNKVDLEPRTVRIEAIEIIRWEPPDLDVRVACHRGTYVRSLARDWGRSLSSAAHVARLRRVQSYPFDVSNALSPEEVERRVVVGDASSVVRPPLPALIETLHRVADVAPEDARRFSQGGTISIGAPVDNRSSTPVVVTTHGSFVGLADAEWLSEANAFVLHPRFVWSPA